jgi:hypothetical protein
LEQQGAIGSSRPASEEMSAYHHVGVGWPTATATEQVKPCSDAMRGHHE